MAKLSGLNLRDAKGFMDGFELNEIIYFKVFWTRLSSLFLQRKCISQKCWKKKKEHAAEVFLCNCQSWGITEGTVEHSLSKLEVLPFLLSVLVSPLWGSCPLHPCWWGEASNSTGSIPVQQSEEDRKLWSYCCSSRWCLCSAKLDLTPSEATGMSA